MQDPFSVLYSLKKNCVEIALYYEFTISPDLGGEDDFRISASSIYFVTWMWQKARYGCSAAQCMGHPPFHRQGLFLYDFLSAAAWEMLQPRGVENFCPTDIL